MVRLLLLISLFGLSGRGSGPVNAVDKLEVNHKLCPSTGQVVFVQVILWQWSDSYLRFEAVGYRVCHDEQRLPHQTAGGIYEFKHHGATIRSARCVQTFTAWDPEQLSLKDLSQADRSRVWPLVRQRELLRLSGRRR